MKAANSQKSSTSLAMLAKRMLCPFCDGNIPVKAVKCPYCFTLLRNEEKPMQQDLIEELKDESAETNFKPPYSKNPDSVDSTQGLYDELAQYQSSTTENTLNEEKVRKIPLDNRFMIASFGLSFGIQLMMFALLILLFSSNGYFHMRFSASYWPLYAVVAGVAFYFSYQRLTDLEKEQ